MPSLLLAVVAFLRPQASRLIRLLPHLPGQDGRLAAL